MNYGRFARLDIERIVQTGFGTGIVGFKARFPIDKVAVKRVFGVKLRIVGTVDSKGIGFVIGKQRRAVAFGI